MGMAPFPGRLLEGPAAWHGNQLSKSDAWIRRFSPSELDRLRTDLDKTRRKELRDIKPLDIGPADLLAEVRDEVLNGRGFVLLRGIQLSDLPIEEAARLFWALGTRF